MRRLQILLAFVLSLNLLITYQVSAAPLTDVTGDQPILDFPNSITFRAKISASANLTSIVIEYGTEQLTCGNVIAKAFPQFTPGTSVGFTVRVADSLEQLAQAPAVSVGSAPEDGSPIDIGAAFGGASPEGNVLELRMTLSPGEEVVPRVSSVALGYACAPILE